MGWKLLVSVIDVGRVSGAPGGDNADPDQDDDHDGTDDDSSRPSHHSLAQDS